MNGNRTKKGGSIAAYMIVGIILAVVLIGAIYIVKMRGEQARRPSEPIAVVDQKTIAVVPDDTPAPEQEHSTATGSNDNSQNVGELPETGLKDVFIGALGIFCLTVSIVGFAKSTMSQKPLFYL